METAPKKLSPFLGSQNSRVAGPDWKLVCLPHRPELLARTCAAPRPPSSSEPSFSLSQVQGAGSSDLKPSLRHGLPRPGHAVSTNSGPTRPQALHLPLLRHRPPSCPGGPGGPRGAGSTVGRGPPCPCAGRVAESGGEAGAVHSADPNQVCQPGFSHGSHTMVCFVPTCR